MEHYKEILKRPFKTTEQSMQNICWSFIDNVEQMKPETKVYIKGNIYIMIKNGKKTNPRW